MTRFFRLSLAVACLCSVGLMMPTEANAQQVGHNFKGFYKIKKGTFELGLDNLLLVRTNTVDLGDDNERSTTDIAWNGGLTPRYFVADNFALAINANLFYRAQSTEVTTGGNTTEFEQTDTGFLGFLMANYYVRLGYSFFLKPGLGVGGFVGTRSTPVTGQPGLTADSSLSGVAGRADLGVAFYVSEHFNLKAGIDIIFRAGEETEDNAPDDAEGQSFTSLDAGFNVGMAYSF